MSLEQGTTQTHVELLKEIIYSYEDITQLKQQTHQHVAQQLTQHTQQHQLLPAITVNTDG